MGVDPLHAHGQGTQETANSGLLYQCSLAARALASDFKPQSFKTQQNSYCCTSASHGKWKKLLNYSSGASE